jgi:uncharacterized membrane protein YczE
MPQDAHEPLIADPHSIPETFITSVVDVALVSNSSVVVSLGVRRYVRPKFGAEPEETVVVNSRLALTLDAAKNLVAALSAMLVRAEEQGAPAPGKLS